VRLSVTVGGYTRVVDDTVVWLGVEVKLVVVVVD
jgi:hypothetical protein